MDLYYIKDFLFYNEMDVLYVHRKVSCHDSERIVFHRKVCDDFER